MIQTLVINALSGQALANGKYQLTLTDYQMKELIADLTHALADHEFTDEDFQTARIFFFEKEGYMGTDNQCIAYWKANHVN